MLMEINKNPMPENLVKWFDIFKGLGEVGVSMVVDLVTKQFTHEGISSHLPEEPYDHYAKLREDIGV